MHEGVIKGLGYIRISDICDGDEDLEGILLVGFPYTLLDLSLDFGLALLSVSMRQQNQRENTFQISENVRRESKFLLVTP